MLCCLTNYEYLIFHVLKTFRELSDHFLPREEKKLSNSETHNYLSSGAVFFTERRLAQCTL